MTTTTKIEDARLIGARIGKAIARDVIADPDMSSDWTGLDAQDGDQLLIAGFSLGTPEWAAAEASAHEAYDLMMAEECELFTICGKEIKHDRSGVGHCWVDADDDCVPQHIAEEIAAEILSGKDTCDDYVASNGQHYCW